MADNEIIQIEGDARTWGEILGEVAAAPKLTPEERAKIDEILGRLRSRGRRGPAEYGPRP